MGDYILVHTAFMDALPNVYSMITRNDAKYMEHCEFLDSLYFNSFNFKFCKILIFNILIIHLFKVNFTKTEHQLRVPFVIYADFGSALLPKTGCRKSAKKSWTEKRQLHKPCDAGLQVKSSDPRFFRKPVVLCGGNVAEKFLDNVMSVAHEIRHFFANKINWRS